MITPSWPDMRRSRDLVKCNRMLHFWNHDSQSLEGHLDPLEAGAAACMVAECAIAAQPFFCFCQMVMMR